MKRATCPHCDNDKYDCMHEQAIVKAPYETDIAFFERTQRMLDELWVETP